MSDQKTELPALWSKEEIKADQNEIRPILTSLDARIHRNAVQCMMHAEKHGDTSLMRRLLVDIVDAKSGYRRQGIIAWMKEFSPMRLSGDVINLSGMTGDQRQAFRCEQANNTPFTQLASAREMVPFKPVFRDNLTSKIERAIKEFKTAYENTVVENGKVVGPKEIGKPFYDGVRIEAVEAAFDKIESVVTEVLSWNDSTKDAREAAAALKKAELEMTQAS